MIQMEQLRRLSELRQTKVDRLQRELVRARSVVQEATDRLAHRKEVYATLIAQEVNDVDITDDTYLADPSTRFIALAHALERKRQSEADAYQAITHARADLDEMTENVDWILRVLVDAEARKKSVDELFNRAARKAAAQTEAREEENALEQFMTRGSTMSMSRTG